MGCVHEEREQIAEYVHEESQDGFAHDLEAHAEEVAAIFKALSSHKRLLIVCSLLDGLFRSPYRRVCARHFLARCFPASFCA